MPENDNPFDDIRTLLAQRPTATSSIREEVRGRNARLVKAPGSLGRLEDVVEWIALAQDRSVPRVDKPFCVLFAANNGVAKSIAGGDTAESARQKLELCAAGGAAVNQIAATYGVGLKVFDLALDLPTADMTIEPALDAKAAAATCAFGMEAIAGEPDLLCLGAFGPGNEVVAAAIFAALWGGDIELWIPENLKARQDACVAIEKAFSLHRAQLSDPLEIMRRIGGRETCALAGAIAAARLQHVPVVLDGHSDCAAAALLQTLDPSALDHCLAGHVGADEAHARALERLGKKPLLTLDASIGEGVGSTLAAGIVKAAIACHNDMATWEQAGVRPAQAENAMDGGKGKP